VRNGYLQCRFGYRAGVGSRWCRALAPLALLHPCGTDALAIDAMFLARPGEKASLLEIGCGDGLLLERMRARGWDAQGIEFDEQCVERVRRRGLPCLKGDVRDHALRDNLFDAIFVSHVIEHVYDPVSFLSECVRILKPGGQLVVLTPNSESWGHRHFRSDWRGLEPPRHLQIFDTSNLLNLARNAGFAVTRVRTTNRGAWYLLGTSSAIRDSRLAHSRTIQRNASLLSLSGIWWQVMGRIIVLFRPRRGEEIVMIAKKGDGNGPLKTELHPSK
jgi:2-polyprenyl-3-methyl-5-hydroxy-6-metoxy-1,4-benzoquinol methylase